MATPKQTTPLLVLKKALNASISAETQNPKNS
jgi:hypothetical protein